MLPTLDPWALLGAIIAIAIPIWFYPHCARPALAYAGARRHAFLIAMAATAAGVDSGVLLLADAVIEVPSSIRQLGIVSGVLWIPAGLSFLVPNVVVRVTGGRDETAWSRFILIWLRSKWNAAADDADREALIAAALRELDERGASAESPDPVGTWVATLLAFHVARQRGATSTSRSRTQIEQMLSGVRPLDAEMIAG